MFECNLNSLTESAFEQRNTYELTLTYKTPERNNHELLVYENFYGKLKSDTKLTPMGNIRKIKE